ncbi:unnamed protein product, partial [Meganyctiphanes norvegica]
TIYQTCMRDQKVNMSLQSHDNLPEIAASNITDDVNGTLIPPMTTPNPINICHQPWSIVPDGVFPVFWRIVYWTSQFLTWLILPLMQSYTKAGDFSLGAKLRSAVIDNAIYYGSYLLIVGILLLYIALTPGLYLDG